MWTVVDFGKWTGKGKTLPQIITSDPDWFFWATGQGAFARRGTLAGEANLLDRRARTIRLPPATAAGTAVRYWFAPGGRFAGVELVEPGRPPHAGSSTEIRLDCLDLSVPGKRKAYDKLGAKLILGGLKYHWFANKRFTKPLVESFFADGTNFL